jgi:hypothetical protein
MEEILPGRMTTTKRTGEVVSRPPNAPHRVENLDTLVDRLRDGGGGSAVPRIRRESSLPKGKGATRAYPKSLRVDPVAPLGFSRVGG